MKDMSEEGIRFGAEGRYVGAGRFRPFRVELEVSDMRRDEVRDYIFQIVNLYSDLVLSTPAIEQNKISFEIGSPSAGNLTAADVKSRIEEFLDMYQSPFGLKDVSVKEIQSPIEAAASQLIRMSAADYNIGIGKEYAGAAKFKPVRVAIEVSDLKTDETKYYINEIANQYADFVLSDVNIGSDKIEFNIGSPSMEDLKPDDIKFRIEEFLTMNVPPFNLKNLKVA